MQHCRMKTATVHPIRVMGTALRGKTYEESPGPTEQLSQQTERVVRASLSQKATDMSRVRTATQFSTIAAASWAIRSNPTTYPV